MTAPAISSNRVPRVPGLVLGVGFGGLIDGVVLHQILQWHHMLSDTEEHPVTSLAGLEENTLADGFFHLATWILILIGVLLTVRAWRRGEVAPPWRVQIGNLLIGWGGFNVVEGLIDHLVLGVHHVRDDLGGPLGWDLGFLAFGALLLAAGLVLTRPAPREAGA